MRVARRAAAALSVALCCACAAPTASAAERFSFETTPGRLPKDAVPTLYRLSFGVDPDADRFAARAAIDFELRRAAESITLNAVRLQAKSVRVRAAGSGDERELTVTPDEPQGQWRLAAADRAPLAPGRYTLSIDYEGQVQRTGQGLYRVDYRAKGKPARMLATQLQPIHARALFPGFDEPAFRAAFEIEAVVDARLQAVSNMPVAAEEPAGEGRKRVRFERTPPMPTYLVALAVGDFDALEDGFDSVALRILTARGKKREAAYAMDVTKRVLAYLRDYFGRPYMLPKLDQIAVPGVRGGAMEDWGAISYNENLLLFDPQRSPPRQRETIFNLVAHEIAHQWFGNLVTTAWWDHIWLNEAFATWIAAKAQHELNPAWNARLRGRLHVEEALARDAGPATRAMDAPPAHEAGIFQVFDEITYDKGGAVLSMFEAHLGADVLRDGLRRYVAAHAYSNATAADLWFHLSQAAGRDLAPMIGAWTAQPGVPLVEVRTRCRAGKTEVELKQQRLRGFGVPPDGSTRWPIPLRLAAGGQRTELLLEGEAVATRFDGCVPVVANAGDLGYYRVAYDAGNLARLRAAYAKLSPYDRMGLVADSFALVRAARAPLAQYLALLETLRGEREGAIWQQVIGALEFLDETFAGTPAQSVARARFRGLLSPVLARLGWSARAGDDSGTLRLRNDLIDALGRFDDPQTIATARRLYARGALDPSVRAGIVRTVARHADAATFERLRAQLKAATNQEDDYLLGGALITVRDPVLVRRLLDLTLSDEWKPGSASYYAREIGVASGQPELARQFVEENWEPLATKSSAWSRPWLLARAYAGFSDAARADQLLAAQKRLLGDEGAGPAEQIAASIREKAALREREAAAFAAGATKRPRPRAGAGAS